MINFSNHGLGFDCLTIWKFFASFVSFYFKILIAHWGTCTLFHVENNEIAPLILKIISQIVFKIYILKTFLLQYVSHNRYQKVVKDSSILIANIYLKVTIIIIKISSWMAMILLLLLITLRESRRHKREWNYLNI